MKNAIGACWLVLVFNSYLAAQPVVTPSLAEPSLPAQSPAPFSFKVMTWNIWHGGRENGEQQGPLQTAQIIKQSGADLVALQETYGSGEILAKETGLTLHPRGTNVSILSRYPILEDISVFAEFKCIGAMVELPHGQKIAFYSIWLPYDQEIWEPGTRDTTKPESMLAACDSSARDLRQILREIEFLLKSRGHSGIPIILAGDFNSMSHLDYTAANLDQYQVVVDWPTSKVAMDAGFTDSYRAVNPVVDRVRDRTWSPRFPNQEQDRIDFIYWRGTQFLPTQSKILNESAPLAIDGERRFPSDHAAVITEFDDLTSLAAAPATPLTLRAASYNIRHGEGMDHQVDLARTAEVLDKLEADIIAIQEVDLRVERSGRQNQAAELGQRLHQYAAFSPFMDYQGGQYGIAILTRLPVLDSWSIPLPPGGEPRSAAAIRVRLGDGSSLVAIAVHFDWLRDDAARYEQAVELHKQIAKLKDPVIVLGDYNALPDSRVLRLFKDSGSVVDETRATFPSDQPKRRLDYITVFPQAAWKVKAAEIISEPLASDHLPIVSDLELIREPGP